MADSTQTSLGLSSISTTSARKNDQDESLTLTRQAKKDAQLPASPLGPSAKRKRGSKTSTNPSQSDWDVLPHGMGMRHDFMDGCDHKEISDALIAHPAKRNRRVATRNDDPTVHNVGNTKTEDDFEQKRIVEESAGEAIVAQDNGLNGTKKPIGRRSTRSKKPVVSYNAPQATTTSTNEFNTGNDHGQSLAVKSEKRDSTLIEDGFRNEKIKTKRAFRNAKATKSSLQDKHKSAVEDEEDDQPKKGRVVSPKFKFTRFVGKKDDDMKDENSMDGKSKKKRTPTNEPSGVAPKKERKKSHPYGLTPGASPFPDHVMPTPEACEDVHHILKQLHDPHDKIKPPKVIPPPSMDVTGCGEVPDLLDAMLRTLLSAATTGRNSAMALKGLKDKFGTRTTGLGKGSVNWDAVHAASVTEIIDAVKSGGLGKSKGTHIKAILDTVYERNKARRDALLKEIETKEPGDVLDASHDTQAQKDAQLARFDETLLAMDYVFEMPSDEAMDEMIKLPGIGVKTASCVILFNMQRPSFAVDTHVWRHCKWLGWVPEKADRDKTFSHCEVRIPNHLKYSLHQLFIAHGKNCGRCRADTSPGSEVYENAVCPIEHLVKRTGKRKMIRVTGQNFKTSAKKAAKGKKGKNYDEDTEESNDEMAPGESDIPDDVGDNESEAVDDER